MSVRGSEVEWVNVPAMQVPPDFSSPSYLLPMLGNDTITFPPCTTKEPLIGSCDPSVL